MINPRKTSGRDHLGNPLGNALPPLASGYFGTPCERMQRE